jgi:hypothetical protein
MFDSTIAIRLILLKGGGGWRKKEFRLLIVRFKITKRRII